MLRVMAFQTVLAALSLPLAAATFSVNVTSDSVDANLADGLCQDAALKCSLRAAVMQANETDGVDTITLGVGTYRLSITGRGEDVATQGDLDITEAVTIQGAGMDRTIIDANDVDRVFHLLNFTSGTTITISDLTIQNGMALSGDSGGAGILNWSFSDAGLSLYRTRFIGNEVGGTEGNDVGGALKNLSSAVVNDSIFQGNSAARGGAIFSNSALTVNRSTFYENNATVAGGALLSYGTTNLNNSTFSRNSAASNGGAIVNNATMTILFCTIAYNTTPTGGGGGIVNESAGLTIANSIIAYHYGMLNCKANLDMNSTGHNLEDANTCSFDASGDWVNTDPQLDLLGYYGGATPTHRLRPTSVAIDAAVADGCFPTDQRGIHRPWGRGYDIGAYEWVGSNPALLIYLLH